MNRSVLGACALVVFASGCVGPDAVTRDERAIVNGTPTTGDDPVVALMVQGFDFCTGTLIAPKVVLTAAHCVDPSFGGFPASDIVVYFGYDVSRPGTMIAVTAGEIHPDWDSNALFNDIALLALESAASTPPKPLHRESLGATHIGKPVRLVGFGVTSSVGVDSGIKREAASVLTEFDATTFTNSDAPGQTCFGDSGGPLFMTPEAGVESVAGVTSWGDQDCTEFGVNTRVDVYISSFIAPFVRNHSNFADTGALCERAGDCGSGLCLASIADPNESHCAEVCDVEAAVDECPAGPDGVKTVCTATTTPDFSVCAHPGPAITCADVDGDCHPGCTIAVAARPRKSWPASVVLLLFFVVGVAVRRRTGTPDRCTTRVPGASGHSGRCRRAVLHPPS